MNCSMRKKNVTLRFPNQLSSLKKLLVTIEMHSSPAWKFDFPWFPTNKADFPLVSYLESWFPTWKAATARGSAEGSPNPTSSLAILNTEKMFVLFRHELTMLFYNSLHR